MTWIASLFRIVGASIPFGSSVVQLQSELDAHATQKRLLQLEDPISTLHPGVREVSRLIYAELADSDDGRVILPDEIMERHSRAFAMLEASGYIKGVHSLQKEFLAGFRLTSPAYVMYMAALYEDPDLMERLVAQIDGSERGTWLKGHDLASEFMVPLPVIRAVFELYEARGLGHMSRELGVANYYAKD